VEFEFHAVLLTARIVGAGIDEGSGVVLIGVDADMLYQLASAKRPKQHNHRKSLKRPDPSAHRRYLTVQEGYTYLRYLLL
jgi:hypothetical protein